MTTRTTTRRALVTALPALAVGAVAPAAAAIAGQDDAPLRGLWAEYLDLVRTYREAAAASHAARAAFEQVAPPCPDNTMPGDHWGSPAVQELWAEIAEPAWRRWDTAGNALCAIVGTIQATPAEGLVGIGIKLAAMHDNVAELDLEDFLNARDAAMADVARLTGLDFDGERGTSSGTPLFEAVS